MSWSRLAKPPTRARALYAGEIEWYEELQWELSKCRKYLRCHPYRIRRITTGFIVQKMGLGGALDSTRTLGYFDSIEAAKEFCNSLPPEPKPVVHYCVFCNSRKFAEHFRPSDLLKGRKVCRTCRRTHKKHATQEELDKINYYGNKND